jgi:hypothetical protein
VEEKAAWKNASPKAQSQCCAIAHIGPAHDLNSRSGPERGLKNRSSQESKINKKPLIFIRGFLL